MKIGNLDLEAVDTAAPEGGSFQSLPAGKYRVMISRADYKATAAGNGFRIPLELTVVGGEFSGRLVFEGLNVVNKNPTAEQIGRQRLAEICDAIGLDREQFSNTDQIEGHIVIAHVNRSLIKDPVSREKYGDDDGTENNVSRFSGIKDSSTRKSGRPSTSPADDDEAPF